MADVVAVALGLLAILASCELAIMFGTLAHDRTLNSISPREGEQLAISFGPMTDDERRLREAEQEIEEFLAYGRR